MYGVHLQFSPAWCTSYTASRGEPAGLAPRWITTIGLVGSPLVFVSSTAVLFGVYDQVPAVAGLAAVPVFLWEMSLAGYLIARGFTSAAADRPTALAA